MSVPEEMSTAWERRLHFRVNDKFAAAISGQLDIRMRSGEQKSPILGQQVIQLGGDQIAFLSVEVGEGEADYVRLIGPESRLAELEGADRAV